MTTAPEQPERRSLGQKLQAMPSRALYLILMVLVIIPLFIDKPVPTAPKAPAIALFSTLMTLPTDRPVIVQSDFTNSTRGENRGQFEALMRILMRRNIKFALLSVADPQAPQVARNALGFINEQRKAAGQKQYQVWEDYIDLGYFPNAEGTAVSMANNLRNAWKSKRNKAPDGNLRNVFESPVLQNVQTIEDCSMMIDITGSNTLNVLIERIGTKTQLAAMVTGVMGPESLIYFTSGQLVGLANGLNGVVDIEWLMDKGVNYPDEKGKIAIAGPGPQIPPFRIPGDPNLARGMKYYLALHVAFVVIILVVILGNVGMALTRRSATR